MQKSVFMLENKIANYFGAPFGIATDSCTHAIELCLRYCNVEQIKVPTRTYISIPFLSRKLNIKLDWCENKWKDYYYLTKDVIDAAVLWEENSYIPNTFMNLSFQFQKHLSLGRGGMILTDNVKAAKELKKMSYDGRIPEIPWRDQDISTVGYHYYMTPEIAEIGLSKLDKAILEKPNKWVYTDWPNLRNMKVFSK